MTCPWKAESLLAAAQDEEEFFRYCAGVAYEIQRRWDICRGLSIQILEMELPLKKGVSSSAAVCILVARAFSEVYGLNLFPHELMELSYIGERLTGSQCGRMDQACIYGSVPVLLIFDKSRQVRIEPIFAKGRLYLFYVDLAGAKDTVTILKDLNTHYLKDDKLQKALGIDNERIVRRAFHLIQNGEAESLGNLMSEAQAIFDTHVAGHSTELQAPLLHKLFAFTDVQRHIYGGKGVGSQGDGTAQFVARSDSDRTLAMKKIIQGFPRMRCFPLTIQPSVWQQPRLRELVEIPVKHALPRGSRATEGQDVTLPARG